MFTMEQKTALKSNIWKVFEIFVDEPLKIHYIKQISKKINLAPTSVKIHLQKLEKENLTKKEKGEIFSGYKANRDYEDFLFYKKISNITKIKESGLLNYLIDSIYPQTINLYGSYLRGEDIEKSDIDIFIISKSKKRLELEKFEKILNRKIHLIIEKDFKNISKGLKLEIINGLVLYGYLNIDRIK